MITCTATLDPAFIIAPVPPRLFGSFVEHMGRCVYEGIFEPGSSNADADGLRLDVLQLTRELGVSVVRYPGGNFVSGYNWEDGVGPVDARPVRLDLAWRTIEPNTFGLNEFMRWIGHTQAKPMLAVNLGTRGVAEAVSLLEYTNFPQGTKYSDLRISHGQRDPYAIKLWCLGNEMDGQWQIGHKIADEYGRLAAETAKAMRLVDPSIELVVCGSSHERMPTFGTWEVAVLEHAYEHVDYLSLHAYYRNTGDDRISYLASADSMDDFIAGVVATCDHVAAKKRTSRKLMLSFDEWNVEHRPYIPQQHQTGWTRAPRIAEDDYTPEDAVVVGNLLISLLRHSDRVAIACHAQLVNVIAPIRTEAGRNAWRQTIFYPFALTARHARGDVLRVETRCDTTINDPTRGDIRPIDMVATRDAENGATTIFAVNRSVTDEALLDLTIVARDPYRIIEHLLIVSEHDRDDAPHRPTTGRAAPTPSNAHEMTDLGLRFTLPPASWTMVRLAQDDS